MVQGETPADLVLAGNDLQLANALRRVEDDCQE